MNLDVSHIFLIFFFLLIQRPLISTLFPYTTLFRSIDPGLVHLANSAAIVSRPETWADMVRPGAILFGYHPGYDPAEKREEAEDRKSTRLNSSHVRISYAVFCLKKKINKYKSSSKIC